MIYISTSIENWKEKIMKKYGHLEKQNDRDIFFGLYSRNDYKRLWQSNRKRVVVWCGADILYLKQLRNWWRRLLLKFLKVDHICENYVQKEFLKKYGIKARIVYNFYGDVDDFPISFKPSKTPHVWMSVRKWRGREYGLDIVEKIAGNVPEITFHIYGTDRPFHEVWEEQDNYGLAGYKVPTGRIHNLEYATRGNIIYHGEIPEQQLNEEVKNYQAGLRLNQWDGFSEILAKSILLGQYPISRIVYPYVDSFTTEKELVILLQNLKYKNKPNYKARNYYKKRF